jgi:hypothetical protein
LFAAGVGHATTIPEIQIQQSGDTSLARGFGIRWVSLEIGPAYPTSTATRNGLMPIFRQILS